MLPIDITCAARLQDLIPTLAGIYTEYIPAKVGIKSCSRAGGCVSFVYECSYPAAIVFNQTHVVSIGNTGW